mgnify:CR=1 FL=1|jgi:hypothetical protein
MRHVFDRLPPAIARMRSSGCLAGALCAGVRSADCRTQVTAGIRLRPAPHRKRGTTSNGLRAFGRVHSHVTRIVSYKSVHKTVRCTVVSTYNLVYYRIVMYSVMLLVASCMLGCWLLQLGRHASTVTRSLIGDAVRSAHCRRAVCRVRTALCGAVRSALGRFTVCGVWTIWLMAMPDSMAYY